MKIPGHIGIIPDGNRRWALNHNKEKFEGYKFGINPGLRAFKLLRKLGVEEMTFYGFTADNCKREKNQRIAFSKACVKAVNLIAKENVEILVVGNQNSKMFPEELIKYTKRNSANSARTKVNFLINYSWDWDIQKIRENKSIYFNIYKSLYSSDISRIDLIIRWGGMQRLSGFLPVQSVYSDIFSCKSLWPDFEEQDILSALDWYKYQDSTLGG